MSEILNTSESWKIIDGFPYYMVSNHGRIRSINKRKGSSANVNGGILKGWCRKNKHGKIVCKLVALRKSGETHEKRVHRIVLKAFVGPCPDRMEGCHNDGDPTNNHVDNLRWDTHKANMNDQIRHGTKSDPPIHIGENHPNSSLTKQDVKEIRSTPIKHGTKTKLAERFNTTITTISRILNRQVWTHI